MYDAVGARWYQYMERRRDVIGIGTARLSFTIDRSGRVNNLRVLENTANEAFAGVCLQSVQELKLPAIPEDVASTLPSAKRPPLVTPLWAAAVVGATNDTA